jgi:DNA-binding MarR family transcriptional regulator
MSSKRTPRGDHDVALELQEFTPYLFHLITSCLNQRLLERLRPHGVTVQRWRVLMVVANLGPRTIGELVELTLIPQSALSRVVDQMERDGLVARWASKNDNRSVRVQLTEHGRTMYQKLAPIAREHAAGVVTNFDASEFETLQVFLRRVLSNLGVHTLTEGGLKPQRERTAEPQSRRARDNESS